MTMSRCYAGLSLLVAAAACAAGPGTARVSLVPGCYSLYAADWDATVASATGLRGLPPYVELDTTSLGVRGRRLVVPPAWQGAGPNPQWASWRSAGSGVVLSFQGFAGTLEVSLRRTEEGFSGEGVTPLRGAPDPVQVILARSSCVGLRAGAAV